MKRQGRHTLGFRSYRMVIGVAAVALASPAAAQNLVVNGNFAVNGGDDTVNSAASWTPLGRTNSYAICVSGLNCAGFFPTTPPAAVGPAFAYITPGNGGGVGQTVNLTTSGRYQFSFYHEMASGFGGTKPTLNVTVGGQTVFNATDTTTSWTLFSTVLKLTAGSSAVDLIGVWNGGAEDVIGNVSLTFLGPNALTPLLPQGAPTNVINVAGGIDNFINGGGLFTGGFQALSNLSGQQLSNALVQLDGEASTGAEKASFQLMNQFLGLMLDPFVDGRFGAGTSSFAPERADLPPEIALAYASILKAPPKPVVDNRWSVWGAGFGGSSHTDGNANVGSSDITASTYGFASGADYHFTRETLAGFALAGAGTNWNLAQGLGGGRSDAFQAGVYGKTAFGPVYLAAALAFTENWFTTNRVALGDQLTAKFNGDSYGGRLESGYRYILPSSMGQFEIAPYAAIQAQSFRTPNYSETDLTGGGLGLNFNAMNATDTRSELGARFADMTAVDGMPLILRARLAWAHDWVDNPALSAAFQALPGSSFIVNGAAIPANSALVSAGAELHINTRWSVIAKFDGEFANNSQTYAGTGTLRYTW